MRPKLMFGEVVAKALPIYTCDGCGATAAGATVRIEIKHMNFPARLIADELDNTVPSNAYMPVGWSGHGKFEHRCPKCSK